MDNSTLVLNLQLGVLSCKGQQIECLHARIKNYVIKVVIKSFQPTTTFFHFIVTNETMFSYK
jgi:hypothetical protein